MAAFIRNSVITDTFHSAQLFRGMMLFPGKLGEKVEGVRLRDLIRSQFSGACKEKVKQIYICQQTFFLTVDAEIVKVR